MMDSIQTPGEASFTVRGLPFSTDITYVQSEKHDRHIWELSEEYRYDDVHFKFKGNA
jgi:hypothetical protein